VSGFYRAFESGFGLCVPPPLNHASRELVLEEEEGGGDGAMANASRLPVAEPEEEGGGGGGAMANASRLPEEQVVGDNDDDVGGVQRLLGCWCMQ